MDWNNSSFSVQKDHSLTSKNEGANKQRVTVRWCGNQRSGFNLVGGLNGLFAKPFCSQIKKLKKLQQTEGP